MATKKFSEFDSVPTPVLADIELVGLDDAGQNARFPGSAFDGAAWGNITGTLADQTDLNSALNGKEDSLGNPGTNGYVLSSTTGGVRSWVPLSVGWDWITATSTAQTTDAATPQLLILGTPADGARESWELLVTGNRQTTAGTVFASLIFTVTRVGATCVVSSSPEIKKVTTGTGNTTTITVGSYLTSFFAIVYGNASETWDWKAQYRHRTIS